MIVLNDWPTRLMPMPAFAASDLYTSSIALIDAWPVGYSIVNLACWPLLIPVPHLGGSPQVITPPTSDQPWLASSAFALAMLNGYGPWPPFSVSIVGTHWLIVRVGIGPGVG